jgi:hypothetical protein
MAPPFEVPTENLALMYVSPLVYDNCKLISSEVLGQL